MDGKTSSIDIRKSIKALKWYERIMIFIMLVIAVRAMIIAFESPDKSSNPAWLTIINFVSSVCGIFCIFFTAKAHISNFPFAIVNTLTYVVYLWYWKIYGTCVLELLFYLPTEIISWIVWVKHKDEDVPIRTKAKKLSVPGNILVAAVIGVMGIVYHAVLVRLGGTVARLDAYTVSIGIAATVLEMLRYREQYIWWLVTDFVAVAMYITHFDAVYLTKKSIYLVMAIIGLINWIKLSRDNMNNK